jgi:hypothetical protein
MSIKKSVHNLRDSFHYALLKARVASNNIRLSFTPVFHIEQLDVDEYFERMLRFTRYYSNETGKRCILTFITPASPILRNRLLREGFSLDAYGERILALAKQGIPGLHGHYIRDSNSESVEPMHHAFYDRATIVRQLATEVEWLERHNLLPSSDRYYSGGWWYSDDWLREELASHCFKWDFSLCSCVDHRIPYLAKFEVQLDAPLLIDALASGESIYSALAISAPATRNRPLSLFPQLNKVLSPASRNKSIYFSLYSHDFDLHEAEAKEAIQAMKAANISFFEPADLSLIDMTDTLDA